MSANSLKSRGSVLTRKDGVPRAWTGHDFLDALLHLGGFTDAHWRRAVRRTREALDATTPDGRPDHAIRLRAVERHRNMATDSARGAAVGERAGPGDSHVAGARVFEIFEPSGPQRALYDRLKRFNVLVCHRGFGKTFLAVNLLIRQAVKRPGTTYAFITKTYRQAKDIAWDTVLKRVLVDVEAEGQVRFNEAELRAVFSNGSQIKLYGAENAETLRGLHLDGVVFDEYGLIAPTVWEQIVSPTLSRRTGGAIFIGTPMGRNHFHSLYKHAQGWPDWYATVVRADERGVLSDEALALQRQIQTPEQYAQEYECSWDTAIHGAYYARELAACRAANRIRAVPWESSIEVETWWDLGHTDATAIVFTQQLGPRSARARLRRGSRQGSRVLREAAPRSAVRVSQAPPAARCRRETSRRGRPQHRAPARRPALASHAGASAERRAGRD